jgi:hypothetical protein
VRAAPTDRDRGVALADIQRDAGSDAEAPIEADGESVYISRCANAPKVCVPLVVSSSQPTSSNTPALRGSAMLWPERETSEPRRPSTRRQIVRNRPLNVGNVLTVRAQMTCRRRTPPWEFPLAASVLPTGR